MSRPSERAPEQERPLSTPRTQHAVGDRVHYVARGSADGVYPPACRAAHITEVSRTQPGVVGLAVLNPTGMFFHPLEAGGAPYDHGRGLPDRETSSTCYAQHLPGSWHLPVTGGATKC